MHIAQNFESDVVAGILRGGIGIIPTDTIYGIVGSLHNRSAIEKIYKAKDRDLKKPVGTILISDVSQIKPYVSAEDLRAARDYWPGPVSVVMNVANHFHYAHKGINSLAFRVPDNKELVSFLKQTGPLASTSANLSGESTVATIQEAVSVFGDVMDFYVDGGDMGFRNPSKIIKIQSDGNHRVIRGGSK